MPILLLLALWWGAFAHAGELTLWHAYRGEERAALEQALDRYQTANPGVQIVPLAVPYEGYATKLEAAIPRGNGPDLFIAAHERIGAWERAGLLAPLPALPEGLHPTTLAAVRWDGADYGVPLAYKCLALFYNRALISAPPQTTDALVALKGTLGVGVFPLAYQATDPYFHALWMHGFGGGVFDAGEVALDQSENAAALGFAYGLLTSGVIPDEATSALVTQLFNDGGAATVISGPWFAGEIDPGVDYAVSPLPVISASGQPAAPFVTVEAVLLSSQARAPTDATALALWLAGPESAALRARQGRQSVSLLSAWDDPAVASDPERIAFRQQLDAAVPMPNRPEMSATWEPMARTLRGVMRGAVTPETATAAAQQHYDIVARPPPEPANPTPYLAALVLAVLGGGGWLARQAWRRRQEIRETGYAYAYLGPAALSMLILVVVPFVVGAAVSLFSHRDGAFTFVGLANFADIVLARDWPLSSPLSFYYTLLVTVGWTAANVLLHVAFGVALAMLLREPWLKLRGVYRALLILPWAVPNYITALIWKGMFHRQFGAINGLLEALGLEAVSWFGRFSTAFSANLITNTWLGFPFMMVVTLGALQAIPRDLEQAAELDGATRLQRFRHITLPLLAPALLPAVVLGSVWTFNMFNIIYLVSGGEPDGSTEILISEAYRWAFTRGHRYGYAAAYAVLIFFVLLGWSRATRMLLGKRAPI